jgi:hypothetical protein
MKLLKTGLVVVLAGVLGCGGGGGDEKPDASPPDAGQQCAVAPSYPGGMIPNTINAERDMPAGGGEVVSIGVAFNQDQDGFSLQLYGGVPNTVFADGIKPGTYALTGPELNFKTCVVCVLFFGDSMSTVNNQDYFATAGQVVLEEVGPTGTGNLKATLKGVKFQHVMIAPMTFETTPINDGCKTEFAGDIVIDSPIVAAPPMPKRASGAPFRLRK